MAKRAVPRAAAVCAGLLIVATSATSTLSTVRAADDEPPASAPSIDTTGQGPAPQLPPPPQRPQPPAPAPAASPSDSPSASPTAAPADPTPSAAPAAPGAPQGDGNAATSAPEDVIPGTLRPQPPVISLGTPGGGAVAPRPPAQDDGPGSGAPAVAMPVSAADTARQPAPGGFGGEFAMPSYYTLVSQEALLSADLRASAAGSFSTIGPEIYEPVGDTRFKIRPPAGQSLAETLYLRVNTTWIDPVTPPEGSRIRQPGDGQMVLTELYGDVKVRVRDGSPAALDKDGREIPPPFRPAAEGMLIPTGSEISTGEGSSVAMVLYGLQSARVGPGTTLTVRQGITDGRVVTDLNLIDGTVFVRVGGKEEAATFHVRTPVGIARANGSDFAVWYRKEKIVVCSAAGVVKLTDLAGRDLVTLDKYEPGMINIAGIPTLDVKQRAEWLHRMLTLIKRLNGKSTALLAEKAKGVQLNDLEQTWLKRLHPITYYIKVKLIRQSSGATASMR
ncbi:hypothetical protein DB346_05965 [Verrucomicrobia bacterium LW23]|nr:hypothetical protein DB346_05965 [Verrucomicrobia bacterium LW23]